MSESSMQNADAPDNGTRPGDAPRARQSARRPGRHRGMIAAGVIVLWLAGLGLLARRELFMGDADRLAEGATRVQPGASFYAVEKNGVQIGFASSTLDTAAATVTMLDYFVADLAAGGTLHRASANSRVTLSRRLALRDFSVRIESDAGPLTVTGRPDGDSVLTYAIASGDAPADTQRVAVKGPLLLPTVVPLVIALGSTPKVGKRYALAVFDPTSMTPRDYVLTVKAESLFVVPDSAALGAGGRWTAAHSDTVRAWQLASDSVTTGLVAWIDEAGRLVELRQPGGIVLRRMAYEMAFENWRRDAEARASRPVRADEDVIETTAIAAAVSVPRDGIGLLRVRLGNVDLGGYDLHGGRQVLLGNTLTVIRERPEQWKSTYRLPVDAAFRATFARELAPEPLLQSEAPKIMYAAQRIVRPAGGNPEFAAMRLNQWVHDSLRKVITVGLPNALHVLEHRAGDCNEHTQLYVAMARSVGIPARTVAGLAYLKGKFYYHAWPEVFLGTWVAVDPTFGQFPADAGHLRFVTGGLSRQAELLRLLNTLTIDVLPESKAQVAGRAAAAP